MEEREPSGTVAGNVIGAATVESGTAFLHTIKVELPYDLAIPLQGVYPQKIKSVSQRDSRAPMFATHYPQQPSTETTNVHRQTNG